MGIISPAADQNYFRNKVSDLVKIETCFLVFSGPELAGLVFVLVLYRVTNKQPNSHGRMGVDNEVSSQVCSTLE